VVPEGIAVVKLPYVPFPIQGEGLVLRLSGSSGIEVELPAAVVAFAKPAVVAFAGLAVVLAGPLVVAAPVALLTLPDALPNIRSTSSVMLTPEGTAVVVALLDAAIAMDVL